MSDVLKFLPTTVAVVALVLVLGQCRKPRGWVGRFYAWLMGVRHAGVTTWGLSHLVVGPHFAILDVGCGGGAAVERLAAIATQGRVRGIDYSTASIATAQARNRTAIAEGRVEIQQASVSALPFGERTFDLVTAVETHYYWPEPATDLREILRVLKPGGHLAIIAETYRGQTFGALMYIPMMLLRARYLTVEEHLQLFVSAGFSDVDVHTDARKGWICVVGRRPE
jgi:ubiquinone/menaquinone biosynthesis C-methylase UbiE